MLIYTMFFLLAISISFLILSLNKAMSPSKPIWMEKKVPFECGFNPISKYSIPVSMPFFLVAILFLIFDIEITLLVPVIIYLNYLSFMYTILLIVFFALVMLVTLVFEWFMGYLSWMY
uniref:NADH dehydrogenase subunit 3 n=1 Tax=Tetragonula iridipennis TaxID=597212 RepID=UPI0026E2622A|nr:NADH dehydrogenase subunit 3 [Tetragonula iridipennis]WJQ22759.1 NADH dehydrogenase subunit 3 [Tetragonula iridipennis]